MLLRRMVLTALLVGGSVAVPVSVADAASGCPTADPCVAVHLPGGDVQYVTASEILANSDFPTSTQYETRATPNGPTQDSPTVGAGTGLSIAGLLDLVGYDPSNVGFIEIPRPSDGSWSTLQAADVADPSDFQDGLRPVVVADGAKIDYVRPLYPQSSDVNATDELQTAAGGELPIVVHTGSLMTVTATATPDLNDLKVGQKVTFTGQSSGAGSPVYRWAFGDGTTATGRVVVHTFTAAGTYEVQLVVTGAGDSAGAASPLYPTVAGGASPTPNPTTSPGAGSPGPSHSPNPGSPNGGGHGTTPSPHPSGGSGAGGGSRPAQSSSPLPSAPAAPGSASRVQTTAAPVPSPVVAGNTLPVVHGRLVGPGAVLLSADSSSSPQQAVSPSGSAPSTARYVGAGVGSALAIMLLLGAGAARELGWIRRRRRLVRPR